MQKGEMWEGNDFPFLLTELSLLWSHFPWELQSSGSAVLGTHPCHPPSISESHRCSRGEPVSKVCGVPNLLLVARSCAYKSFCSLLIRGGEVGFALLGFPRCRTPAQLPLMTVRISPWAADVERGRAFYSGARSCGGNPVVNGCAWAPGWSTALGGGSPGWSISLWSILPITRERHYL